MALIALRAMVRKDLQLFFSDRRAVIMSFVAPIAIATFFGSIFSGAGSSTTPSPVPVMVADQDDSPISRAIVANIVADPSVRATVTIADSARRSVRRGDATVAIVIPRGFGAAAGPALLSGRDKPQLELDYDPSRAPEYGMVRGMLIGHVIDAITRQMFPGGGMSVPYTVDEQALTANANVAYNGYAHAFAGMGIQFMLFAAIDLGIGVLLERQRGLWKRLRSAPVSRATLLGGKALSGTLITLLTLLVSFAFAIVVFRVRISGSVPGFLVIALATALMAATFGLMIAAIGHTPSATRGVSILGVLLMVMLGGAWVPSFVFPQWLQRLTVVIPTRWAVDGLDAMSWRGIGWSGAVQPVLVLVGFAALFGAIAVWRFRWEES